MRLFSELKRRNVLRMAVLYVVVAWLIIQVAEVLIDLANLPDWIGTTTLGLLTVGFPIALIFSWFYEMTPEGISLEKDVDRAQSITHVTGRRLDFIVISLLCAAVILFAYDKWRIGPPPENSIAVLPFKNISSDPEQEYFSDGISEELLNLLAQIPELRVISRSSAFSFKGKEIVIPTVAGQLNVTHVLEGSVRKMGNRVRITAQLIEARSDSHLWSKSYDRELDDIFAVQNEIAAAISDALKMKLALAGGEAVQPTVIKAANIDAYDAYLRGRELIRLRGRKNLEEAVRHLERSLRLDERFAPAHAQLAIATTLLLQEDIYALEEARRTAIVHLDRAQELEPDLAEAHGGRALLAGLVDGDLEAEIEHTRKALASNPNYTDAMNWLYIALGALGHYEEAQAILEQMLAIDPLSIIGRYNYAEWLGLSGRVDEAHEFADKLLAQNPELGYSMHAQLSLILDGEIARGLSWALKAHSSGYYVLFAFNLVGEYDEARRVDESLSYWADLAERRFDEAIRVTQRNMHLDPDDKETMAVAANALYKAGHIDKALPLFERLFSFVPEGRPMSEPLPNIRTMQLALARRKTGDEHGAQAAAQIARQDSTARRAAGRNNQLRHQTEAMIAAFENHPNRVIAALKSAIQVGLRDLQVFDDPIFEDMSDEPSFMVLRKELEAIVAAEHDNVLQLICFNNPVPEDWQPLPETCEGVVERSKF